MRRKASSLWGVQYHNLVLDTSLVQFPLELDAGVMSGVLLRLVEPLELYEGSGGAVIFNQKEACLPQGAWAATSSPVDS